MPKVHFVKKARKDHPEHGIKKGELWKDVYEWFGLYMISDQGRVMSIQRTIIRSNGRPYSIKEKILRPLCKRENYRQVELYGPGGRKGTFMVHRLVWITFKGPIPKGKELNHINGVKWDNRLSNLELVSHSENMKHAYRIGLKKPLLGEQNHSALVSEQTVLDIRKTYRHLKGSKTRIGWGDLQKIALKFGTSIHSVKSIVGNYSWKHLNK